MVNIFLSTHTWKKLQNYTLYKEVDSKQWGVVNNI